MSNTVINTNVSALNSYRALTGVSARQQKAQEKLSTGQKINRAADDAAGLAISEKMKSQIRGLDQATNNAQDGISLVQTAEGAMEEVTSMLQRMRELAVKTGNDTLTDDDRTKIQSEVDELVKEINSISERTEFNKRKLFSGEGGKEGSQDFWIQTGANENQGLNINIAYMNAKILGVDALDLGGAKEGDKTEDQNQNFVTRDDPPAGSDEVSGPGKDLAAAAIKAIDGAIQQVATQRSNLGANQNRLESTVNNLKVSSENLSAANSRIRDTDMAKEMMNVTQANVLQQAATAMLAQANQAPQSVLQLLQ